MPRQEPKLTDSALAPREHWQSVYAARPRMALPSLWRVSTRNLQTLLKPHIKSGHSVLEIGFAPGKQLAFVAKRYGANVSGLDYAESGFALAKELFATLNINADLRCENALDTTFSENSFDLVYSVGLIEHFTNPVPLIRKHLLLCKPGGLALLIIPNYGGLLGRIQHYLDPDNLAIHNLTIMQPNALSATAPADLTDTVRVFYFGALDVSQLSLNSRLSPWIARFVKGTCDTIGLASPYTPTALRPWLCMEVTRR